MPTILCQQPSSTGLQYCATRILEQCSDSFAERDWKDFKLISSKTRNQLRNDCVRRLIQISCSLRIKQADLSPWRTEVGKYSIADELCMLDKDLLAASERSTSRFKNWIEDEWEVTALVTKNDASYSALKAKYFEVYFLDSDVQSDDGITRQSSGELSTWNG